MPDICRYICDDRYIHKIARLYVVRPTTDEATCGRPHSHLSRVGHNPSIAQLQHVSVAGVARLKNGLRLASATDLQKVSQLYHCKSAQRILTRVKTLLSKYSPPLHTSSCGWYGTEPYINSLIRCSASRCASKAASHPPEPRDTNWTARGAWPCVLHPFQLIASRNTTVYTYLRQFPVTARLHFSTTPCTRMAIC